MSEIGESDPYERLAQAASGAAGVLQRVSGDGSVLDQMRRGEWADGLTPDQAVDLADLLGALMEHARRTRDVAGRLRASGPMPEPHSQAQEALATTFKTLLPLNRKERYYTGTVLPMLAASDGFAHLHRLLSLCGLDVKPYSDHSLDAARPIQIFTEYAFLESRFTDLDKARFADAPVDGVDTPDVVLVGEDWLLAIEAKVFHRPTPAALAAQMGRQQVLVDYWTREFDLQRDRVRHVLLLPEQLYAGDVGYPVITWERVLDAYRVVGPAYWVAMLEAALTGYEDLASKPKTFGINASTHLTGQQIRDAHADGTLTYGYVGRTGGLHGQALSEDADTGRWRYQRYEVRTEALPGNRNWLTVSDFLKRTAAPDSTT